MKKSTRTKIDRLLGSEERLFSVHEKENMLSQLLAEHSLSHQTGEEEVSTTSWLDSLAGRLVLYGLPLAAAASLTLVLWPAFFSNKQGHSPSEGVQTQGFASRGRASAGTKPALASEIFVRCSTQENNNEPVICKRGDKVLVALRNYDDKSNAGLAILGPDGILSWYYPTRTGKVIHLKPGQLASLELPLAQELDVGAYTLFAYLSNKSITRAEMRESIEQFSEPVDGHRLSRLDLVELKSFKFQVSNWAGDTK